MLDTVGQEVMTIDAEQVHDGGVEVVDVELVLHRTLDFQSFLTVPWE